MNKPQSEQHAAIRQAWQDAGLLSASTPAGRRATPEQTGAYRQACFDLFRNQRYEEAARIRTETGVFLDLNDRVCDAEEPFGRLGSYWHWRRALAAEDRDFQALQRASDRQDRERTRPARRRSR
jgi:hypothetical protein